MSYAITIAEVKDSFTTSASDADLTAYIAVVDQADECLTLNNLPFAIGKQLKILGVRHLAANTNDRGSVTQERAVSGASRTYSARSGGETGYLETLRTTDQYGCVIATMNNNARIQFRAIGRRSPEAQS